MRKITFIVIHHTVTSPHVTVDEIRKMHLARGFNDIGYHVLIGSGGGAFIGRPAWRVGAHCEGHNTGSLGLAIIGNFHPPAGGHDVLNQKQFDGIINTCADWCRQYNISADAIYPHRKFKATACPGNNIASQMDRIIKGVKAMRGEL